MQCATSRKVAGSIPDGVHGNCGPEVDSASNRNEYQKYFLGGKGGRCVGLTSPSSSADCLEIWEPQPPGTLRACPDLLQGSVAYRGGFGGFKPPPRNSEILTKYQKLIKFYYMK
jgi:hypothetical protein